jgi:hypothetical protein
VLFFGIFCFFCFSIMAGFYTVLSTLGLKMYELRRGQTNKIRFDRKDMILVWSAPSTTVIAIVNHASRVPK